MSAIGPVYVICLLCVGGCVVSIFYCCRASRVLSYNPAVGSNGKEYVNNRLDGTVSEFNDFYIELVEYSMQIKNAGAQPS